MALEQLLVFAPNGNTIGQVVGPCNWRNDEWLAIAYRLIDGTDGLLTSEESWFSNYEKAREYVEWLGNGD